MPDASVEGFGTVTAMAKGQLSHLVEVTQQQFSSRIKAVVSHFTFVEISIVSTLVSI